MNELETKVSIDQSDVARIKIGDSAIVTLDAFPDSTFRGQVTNISNSSVANGQAVNYHVIVKLFDAPPQTRQILLHRHKSSPTRVSKHSLFPSPP